MTQTGNGYMAARLTKRLADQTRDSIQTSMLIKRLCNHALGECEMSNTQVRAAEILLNKTLPNLKSSDDSLTVEGELGVREIVKEYVGDTK